MTNIQIVEPVEYSAGALSANKLGVKSFGGLAVKIKNPDNQAPLREKVINRLDVLSRFQKDVRHVSDKKERKRAGKEISIHLKLSSFLFKHRPDIFRSVHVAPYATRIKPLDRNFKVRSHSEGPSDVIFYGYLP